MTDLFTAHFLEKRVSLALIGASLHKNHNQREDKRFLGLTFSISSEVFFARLLF